MVKPNFKRVLAAMLAFVLMISCVPMDTFAYTYTANVLKIRKSESVDLYDVLDLPEKSVGDVNYTYDITLDGTVVDSGEGIAEREYDNKYYIFDGSETKPLGKEPVSFTHSGDYVIYKKLATGTAEVDVVMNTPARSSLTDLVEKNIVPRWTYSDTLTEEKRFKVELYNKFTVCVTVDSSVAKTEDGAYTVEDLTADANGVYEYEVDDVAYINVVPIANHTVTVDGATWVSDNRYEVSEDTETVVITYTEMARSTIVIDASAEGVKEITVGTIPDPLYEGTTVKVEATAKNYYTIDEITVDGNVLTAVDGEYKFNTVAGENKVSATATLTGAARINATYSTIVTDAIIGIKDADRCEDDFVKIDATVTVKPTVKTGYVVKTMIVNGASVYPNENGEFTFKTVAGDNNISFSDEYVEDLRSTITEGNVTGSTVDFNDDDGYVYAGNEVVVTAEANDEYYIKNIIVKVADEEVAIDVENNKSTATAKFTAAAKTDYVVDVTTELILEGDKTVDINKYVYLKWMNNMIDSKAVKAEIIDKAFDTVLEDDCIEVEYYAGKVNVKKVIKIVVSEWIDKNLKSNLAKYFANQGLEWVLSRLDIEDIDVWANVESKEDEIYGEIVEKIFTASNVIVNIIDRVGISEDELKASLAEYLKNGSDLHTFGENDSEKVKAEHICENCAYGYGDASAESTINMVDMRTEVDVDINTVITVEYADYTDAEVMGKLLEGKNGVMVDGKALEDHNQLLTLGETLEGKTVGTYEVEVYMDSKEDFDHKDAETVTATVTVVKAPVNVDVPNVTAKYGEEYNASPVVTNKHGEVIKADTIEFIVGIDAANFEVDGDNISGVKGKLNLILTEDFDEIPGLKNGVSLNLDQLMSLLRSGLASGLLENSGISSDMIDVLNQALAGIEGISEIEITIGGAYPTNIGAYLHGAVVLDGNYETAVDVGYIVITPIGQEVELAWNQHDNNGVFTRNTLVNERFDFGAKVVSSIEAAQGLPVTTYFLGVDTNGDVTITNNAKDLKFGAYTQVAFLTDLGNEMYYAEPIYRQFIVTPQIATVEVVDNEAVYNGETHDVTVNVTLEDGNAPDMSCVEVTYVGVDAFGEAYNSTTAPVNAGVYAVYAVYAQKANGVYEYAGFDSGVLVIKPTTATLKVEDTYVIHDGNGHLPKIETTTINDDKLDLIKVIVDKNDKDNVKVNVVLPFEAETRTVNVEEATAELEAILAATGKGYATAEAISNKLVAELNKVDLEKLTVMGADELAAFIAGLKAEAVKASETFAKYDVDTFAAQLAKLLDKVNVDEFTINGTLPKEEGKYDVTVIGFGANYKPVTAKGTLEIHEHDWVDANCTTPKTCEECGETEGEELGHTWGEWYVTKKPTKHSKGEERRDCVRGCGVYQVRKLAKLPSGDSDKDDSEAKLEGVYYPVSEPVTVTPVSTGDNAGIFGYVTLIVAAGAAMVYLFFKKKRV